MLREAKILIDATAKLGELQTLIAKLKEDAVKVSLDECVDIAFAASEAEKNLELTLKAIRDLSRTAETQACISMEALSEEKISTDFVTATPNPRLWFALPYKREGREVVFDAMMKGLGIPEEVYVNELIRFHAPAFVDYCTKLIGECRKPPLGIDPKEITGVELRLRLTKKRKKVEDSAT